ncbi:MAG TPA: hypothetical protein VNI83_14205, partial [Vicinamibacterales bacterium]|nr:hypothetical protein [Vicinamibacterales bacterium]
YHKGGPDRGVFLMITGEDRLATPVPGEGYTFGQLRLAQALGDFEALAARGRRIVRLHLRAADEARALARVLEAAVG